MGGEQGPLSKDNYERFHKSMKATSGSVGTRKAAKYDEGRLVDEVIMERPGDEGGDQSDDDYALAVQQVDNPLMSKEYLKIIDAAIPKYTMKMLMGLSNAMFLTLKSTEFWMKVRGNKH